jgi:hypothetical protein
MNMPQIKPKKRVKNNSEISCCAVLKFQYLYTVTTNKTEMYLQVTNHNEHGDAVSTTLAKIQDRRTDYAWRPTEIEIEVSDKGGAAEEDIEIALRANFMWAGSGNVITSIKY